MESCVIDFHHGDASEFWDYRAVGAELGAAFRPVLMRREADLDVEAVRRLYEAASVDAGSRPSTGADAVVTTRHHGAIFLPEYSRSASVRLLATLRPDDSLRQAARASLPFRSVLVPGPRARDRCARFTRVVMVGLPRYDAFFRGEHDRGLVERRQGLSAGRETVLYLPTHGERSSLSRPEVAALLERLARERNVLIQPHAVTMWKEPQRMGALSRLLGPRLAAGPAAPGELLAAADLVICDAGGDALWDSVLIARRPTLVLALGMQAAPRPALDGLAALCDAPSRLEADLDRAQELHAGAGERARRRAAELVAHTDGTAGRRAAQAILEIAEEQRRSGRTRSDRLRWALVGDLNGSEGMTSTAARNLARVALRRARGARRRGAPRRGPAPPGVFSAARSWIEAHTAPGGGIAVTSARPDRPYPEVTGYFIPTLLNWGERELALQYARWLLTVQRGDGSWPDASLETPYTFDTGQILKGLLAVEPLLPEAAAAIRRGCDWMLGQIAEDGRVTTPDTAQWILPDGRRVPEAIHLYVLEPLHRAADLLDTPRYREAADRALAHYLSRPDLVEFQVLSHFHAYILEALVDLGQPALAAEGMSGVERHQGRDGRVPARPGARWVCSTGLAQYAVVWYKLGRRERGDRAFAALRGLQNASGGFFGGYGRGADYFPDREISWAVKYYLDALGWKIRSAFDAEAAAFPADVAADDGRLELIEDAVRSAGPRRALDAGCGAGRFARRLLERHPELELHGLDVSRAMLDGLPRAALPAHGSLLQIPFPDGHFDLVYSVEALEHAVNIPGAVRELCRVVSAGGTLVIIDKNAAAAATSGLVPDEWETWFQEDEVGDLLRAQGLAVTVHRDLPHDRGDGGDGLFLGWVARRPEDGT